MQSHPNTEVSFSLLSGKNPSKTFCFPHVTFLTCSRPRLVSVSLCSCSGNEIEQLSLIVSVYSPLPPRPFLKLNFSIVSAIKAQSWIFTRICNPEGKKSDIKQGVWVFSEPWQLCEAGFGWAMGDSWPSVHQGHGEGLSQGWCIKSTETKNHHHQETWSHHYHPWSHIIFSEIQMWNQL